MIDQPRSSLRTSLFLRFRNVASFPPQSSSQIRLTADLGRSVLRTNEKAQRVFFYPLVSFLCSPTVASPFNQRSSSLIAVVLLDTTQEEKLEWTKYPFGAEANTPGVSFVINATQSRSAGVVEGPPLRGFHQRRWSVPVRFTRDHRSARKWSTRA